MKTPTQSEITALVACLAAGTVLNVAVAWSCARWAHIPWDIMGRVQYPPTTAATGGLPQREVAEWLGGVPPGFPPQPYSVSVYPRGLGVGQIEVRAYGKLDKDIMRFDRYELILVDAGWPLPALRGRFWRATHTTGVINEHVDNAVLVDGDRMWAPLMIKARLIPLRPQWWGFAANTILYGGAIYLAIYRRRAMLHLLRRHRKRCVECGYPAGASSVCSECGQGVAA